jgi:hypothetical protein
MVAGAVWTNVTPILPVGTAVKLLGAGAELGQPWMRSSFPPCPHQRYGGGGHLITVEEGGRGRPGDRRIQAATSLVLDRLGISRFVSSGTGTEE